MVLLWSFSIGDSMVVVPRSLGQVSSIMSSGGVVER